SWQPERATPLRRQRGVQDRSSSRDPPRLFEQQSRVIRKRGDEHDHDGHDPQRNLLALPSLWSRTDGSRFTLLGWPPPVCEEERSTEKAHGRDQEVRSVWFELQQQRASTEAQDSEEERT